MDRMTEISDAPPRLALPEPGCSRTRGGGGGAGGPVLGRVEVAKALLGQDFPPGGRHTATRHAARDAARDTARDAAERGALGRRAGSGATGPDGGGDTALAPWVFATRVPWDSMCKRRG